MDLEQIKTLGAFAKWYSGDAITPQELATLTTIFAKIPPIATANPQEVVGILSQFAGQVVGLVNQLQQQTPQQQTK